MRLTNETAKFLVEAYTSHSEHAHYVAEKVVSVSTGSSATGEIYAVFMRISEGKTFASECKPAYASCISLIYPNRRRGIPACKLLKRFRRRGDCTGITKITADGGKIKITITKELSISKKDLGLE